MCFALALWNNRRGPVWIPMNVPIIRALLQFYEYYADSFRIECPTGSGRTMNLFEVAREIAGLVATLIRLFGRLDESRFLELGKGALR